MYCDGHPRELGNGARGEKINAILRYSPLPGPVKELLLGHMASIQHAVLGDKVIFMLIVLLLVFDDPEPGVVRIRDQYSHMLRCCSSCAVSRFSNDLLQPVPGPLLPPGAAQRAAGRGVALCAHSARHDSSLQSCLVSRHKLNIHYANAPNQILILCMYFSTSGHLI